MIDREHAAGFPIADYARHSSTDGDGGDDRTGRMPGVGDGSAPADLPFPAGTHPSAPLPPRPAGTWSRLKRRTDSPPDGEATVAQPVVGAPVPPPPAGRDHDGHDDETSRHDGHDEDATGGLEVLADDHHDDHHHHDHHHHDFHHDDDRDEFPRAGRRRRSAARRRRRSPLAAVLSLVVLAALVGGIVLGGRALLGLVNPAEEDYTGQGTGSVEVRVAEGDTLSDIGRTLVEADVIASVGPFVTAAESQPDAMGIQPGVYGLRSQMSGQAALDLLLDPATRLFSRVTIPEGFTVTQVLERVAAQTQTPIEEVQAAAADPAALGLPAYADGQLEGFLFPATYEFEPGTTAAEMLSEMVGQFTTVATRLQLEQRAAAAGRSAYDVVTVGSMVQSETRLDEERPDVAQVIYNRLTQGIPLGIDATLAFGLDKSGNDLTVTDLRTDSPYNTRTRTGLPPTPISSPGEASLEAALAPSTGDLLYYVLQSEDGAHFFTSSYDEFVQARQRCADAGLGCGG